MLCCRGVDHATGVVAALPGAGTLVASASTALLVPTDAPHDKRQVALRLGGRPTCATPLPGGSKVVLGDASGQLHLLDTERLQAAPVAGGLLAAAPSCLAFLAAPAQAAATPAAPAGALFVGSAGGSSALLEVPASPVAGSMQWQAMCGGGAGGLPSSLAPVTSCRLIPDPSGCGDARLLMCCGQAPFARLALARLAAALVPLAVGGGDLPVSGGAQQGCAWGPPAVALLPVRSTLCIQQQCHCTTVPHFPTACRA